MRDKGMCAKEESHPRNPVNNDKGEILVNLNESINDNPYEL